MLSSIILLRKIFMQWMFPPGIIIIAFMLLYFLLILRKKKIATFFMVFFVLILFLLSSWLGEYILLRPLEKRYLFNLDLSVDNPGFINPIIVVLSGDSGNRNILNSEINSDIGEITLSRLMGAFLFFKKFNYPILVSGGIAPDQNEEIPSAIAMKQLLVELGVPENNIITETQSRTTLENAIYTLDYVARSGYQEVLLVTSALHMPRAMLVFANARINIIPIPVNFLFNNEKPGILSIIPNRSSWEHNLRAWHEWIGLFYYKIIGGRLAVEIL